MSLRTTTVLFPLDLLTALSPVNRTHSFQKYFSLCWGTENKLAVIAAKYMTSCFACLWLPSGKGWIELRYDSLWWCKTQGALSCIQRNWLSTPTHASFLVCNWRRAFSSMEVNLCHQILKIKSHWILSTENLCIEITYLDFMPLNLTQ